jgi:catechol 2,3-dioxygenase-like lactoylglutathione lyase family enzyme
MRFHSSVVFVNDIQVSKEFYTRFLGFKIEYDFGKNLILDHGVTLWELDSSHIIAKELQTSVNSNRFELYFEEEDITTFCSDLKKAGIIFLHEIHEEPWGQQTLRFFDPDGHLIEIGEPMEVFVSNMIRKGMTLRETSLKSGIPEETIRQLMSKSK